MIDSIKSLPEVGKFDRTAYFKKPVGESDSVVVPKAERNILQLRPGSSVSGFIITPQGEEFKFFDIPLTKDNKISMKKVDYSETDADLSLRDLKQKDYLQFIVQKKSAPLRPPLLRKLTNRKILDTAIYKTPVIRTNLFREGGKAATLRKYESDALNIKGKTELDVTTFPVRPNLLKFDRIETLVSTDMSRNVPLRPIQSEDMENASHVFELEEKYLDVRELTVGDIIQVLGKEV